MRKIAILLLLLLSTTIYSQKKKPAKLGFTTLDELKMAFYEKDSTANAVVLYENGDLFTHLKNQLLLTTNIYSRIKIFNKKAEDKATIKIRLYKEEKVENIKAITYNLNANETFNTVYLKEKDIFKNKVDENWTEVTFTLPNIKEGSVIEYRYSVSSPYVSQIDDWYFQSDIPKIYSQFDASILGNYQFNTRLVGSFKLTREESSVKKSCVYIPAIGNGSCAVISYGMHHLPAFKEEGYMTSKKNFISRLVLDIKSFTKVDGTIKKYTTTWKKADKTLKYRFLNNQTSKKNFFKKKLPEDLLLVENQTQRAKKVFEFIQNHYSWDERYWSQSDLNIKKSFENKIGSVAEINLSLYNSLRAAEIDSYIVMSSTRKNGIPTNLYPIITDFNYLLVKVIVDEREYFLDATSKYVYFGEVPFKCLNGRARILDFKNESFWQEITMPKKTASSIRVQLNMDEIGDFNGEMVIQQTGSHATSAREKIIVKTKDDYLEDLENTNTNLLIEEYTNSNLENLNKPLIENFKIKLENDLEETEIIRINPFIIGKTTENPFKLKERNYPVDFGYASKYKYICSLKIPDNYTITNLPEDKAIKLPNKGGLFILSAKKNDQSVSIFLRFDINKSVFTNIEYHYLKEFYKQLIEAENSCIEITKK
jgi:hypothetical protein